MSELFGHHAQSAIGEDEVDGAHAIVAIERIQQVLDEDGAAGAGDGNGQRARHWICEKQAYAAIYRNTPCESGSGAALRPDAGK